MNTAINREAISGQLHWVAQRIENLVNKGQADYFPVPHIHDNSAYARFVTEYSLSESDRVLLNLALASTLSPLLLAPFSVLAADSLRRNLFGGIYSAAYGRLYPTLQTAFYLRAGNDEEQNMYMLSTYHRKHKLFTSGILLAEPLPDSYSFADHRLVFNDRFLPAILNGEQPLLDSEAGFPAKRGRLTHTMKDVILDEKTVEDLGKLRDFAATMRELWQLEDGHKYRQNFICVFTGDPGTGKSHTAEALGNELSLPVYKINLAQMVSKYIGETEKNLEKVFDRFSGHPNILFFDEAEAIFSKRTEVNDSHDKYANNEQSYLLQKIEEYNGIIILATNVQSLSQFFDKAFQRRIRQIISFNFPEEAERLRLWQNALGKTFAYTEGLPEKLARNYQLSGGSIYNIISDGVVAALNKKTSLITFELLEPGMKDEFKKTGRKYEVSTDADAARNVERRYGYGYEQRQNF